MEKLSDENYEFTIDLVCEMIEKNSENYLFDLTQEYINCVENYQKKIKVDDFFAFFEYLKKSELPKINKFLGSTLHEQLNYKKKWKNQDYYQRDIRDIDQNEEILINILGGYVNSSLIYFFPKLFKKRETSEAAQLIIEKDVRNYFEKNKKEIYESYSKWLKKEKNSMEICYS